MGIRRAEGHVVAGGGDGIRQEAMDRVCREVKARFAEEMSRAGRNRRIWSRVKIHRAIEMELEKVAPPGALYSRWL